jgi:P-type E1-E2 ATPase
MIELNIPGKGDYQLEHLLLDLNGTIALDGRTIDGVKERLEELATLLSVSIITADTHGTAGRLESDLNTTIRKIEGQDEEGQKVSLVRELGQQSTVCIGNGRNDVSMLREAALGICVVGPEGAAAEAVMASDVAVGDINVALDLLLHPARLIATLRK